MMTKTQNIESPNIIQLGYTGLRKKLSIEFKSSDLTIYINNSYKPPISWFLTDTNGEMVTLGQIAESNYKIDLTEIPSGVYTLRIAGEVHRIRYNK